jgi:hypothetical protein
MPVHNTAQKERKSAGPQEKAGGKVMGRKDKAAVANNWEHVEEYLALLKQRIIVTGLTVAICTRPMGASRYEVQFMDGIRENLPIGGCIKVKNARKLHVQACMSVGDVVLVNGGQITGTLTAGHRVRAESYLRTIQEQGCWVPPIRAFGGSTATTVTIPSEFTHRVDTEARIAFPPTFFGATVHDAEGGAWEFDRDEEVAASGVAPERAREAAAAAAEEDTVNLDDL